MAKRTREDPTPRPPAPEPAPAAHLVRDGDRCFLVAVLPAGPAAPAPDASLTAAEREVASLAVAGCSHAEIAARRGTSKRTVANQLGALYRKLRLASRNELINWWVAHEEPPAPSPPAAPRPGR